MDNKTSAQDSGDEAESVPGFPTEGPLRSDKPVVVRNTTEVDVFYSHSPRYSHPRPRYMKGSRAAIRRIDIALGPISVGRMLYIRERR